MGRGRKKKNKRKKRGIDPHDVLDGTVSPSFQELVRLIHRVNPTNRDLSKNKTTEGYELKSGLQSLLITRFGEELLVERSNLDNPGLISLKPRFFDDNACHALLSELDPDARFLAQRQLDEASASPDADDPSAGSGKRLKGSGSPGRIDAGARGREKKGVETFSPDELLRLGGEALEAYDYETCEAHYRRAFDLSGGGLDAARSLLEFLVDHLAAYEKAAELADSLSAEAGKDGEVKTFVALALAQCGIMDRAMEFLDRDGSPRAAQVHLVAAKHYVKEGNVDAAREILPILRSFNLPDLALETDALERDVHQLRIRDFKPLERKMLRAWREERLEEAAGLADELLAEWPENREARRIRRELARQRRADEIDRLVEWADEANSRADFTGEADLLKKAIRLGPKNEALVKRLARARGAAKRAREEWEVAETVKQWRRGERREALLSFAKLSEKLRRRIMEKRREAGGSPGSGISAAERDCFSRFSRILSARPPIKVERMADAILAFGEAGNALRGDAEPGAVISMLLPHEKALEVLPEVRDVIGRAERLLKEREADEARRVLRKAGDCIEKGDLESTRECVDKIKTEVLNEEESAALDDIRARLDGLTRIRRMNRMLRGAEDRADYLTARNIARRLAEIEGPDAAALFHGRIAKYTSLLEKEWRLAAHDIETIPSCCAAGDRWSGIEDAAVNLTPDGRRVIVASTHDRRTLLKFFCIEDGRFDKAVIFQAPGDMTRPLATLFGDEIWVVGEEGHVAAIALDPLDVLLWRDFSDFVNNENGLEYKWLFPGSRRLWMNSRKTKSTPDDDFEVVHVEKTRVDRRLTFNCHPVFVNRGGRYHALIKKIGFSSVQVCSEQGRPLSTFYLGEEELLGSAAPHPNGVDYVLLTYADSPIPWESAPEDEDGDEEQPLIMRVAPDVDNKYEPYELEGSDGESVHSVATSLEKGLIFVSFTTLRSTVSYFLAAFRPTGDGFEKVYQVGTPRIDFVIDEFSRNVAAVRFRGNEPAAVLLDENEPVFPGDEIIPEPVWPRGAI